MAGGWSTAPAAVSPLAQVSRLRTPIQSDRVPCPQTMREFVRTRTIQHTANHDVESSWLSAGPSNDRRNYMQQSAMGDSGPTPARGADGATEQDGAEGSRNGEAFLVSETPMLTLRLVQGERESVVGLSGELDLSSAPPLRELLARVLTEDPPSRIVLELSDLDYLDSTGLSVFVTAHKRAQRVRYRIDAGQSQPLRESALPDHGSGQGLRDRGHCRDIALDGRRRAR